MASPAARPRLLSLLLLAAALVAVADAVSDFTVLHWTKVWSATAPSVSVDCRAHAPCGSAVRVTPRRASLRAADAVAFHAWDIRSDDLPPRTRAPWVLRSQESPVTCAVQANATLASLFNLTMSYRLDSDAPVPYFPRSAEWLLANRDRPLPEPPAGANASVAFVASHCGVASGRDEYVRELSRHIAVDSLGACLNNVRLPPGLGRYDPGRGDGMEEFLRARGYRFFLSFENSRCRDYVTEKLYNALRAGLVPVYRGAPNARSGAFLPAPESVIVADDFGSPAELAAHLRALLARPDELARHTAWLREGRVDPRLAANIAAYSGKDHGAWCRLCGAVRRGRARAGVAVDRTCAEPLPAAPV